MNGREIWRTLRYNLLLDVDLELLLFAMPRRTHGMIMCPDALQRVRRIVDVT